MCSKMSGALHAALLLVIVSLLAATLRAEGGGNPTPQPRKAATRGAVTSSLTLPPSP